MSRIDARNGAFGIVPPELDGALITGDFPLFRVDSSVILPEFLALIVRSSEFNEICKRSSKGTTNRKRLREGILLNQQIAVLEDLDAQRIAVEVASSFRKVKESLQLATGASNFLDAAFADELSSLTGV
jgi:restriction endonuclease S subunit